MMRAIIFAITLLLAACGGGASSVQAPVAPPKALNVYLLGDSITAGTIGVPGGNVFDPAHNWTTMLGMPAKNVAVPGAMITNIIATQLPQAMAARPDVVVLWVGVNDAGRMTAAEYQSNLDTAVAMLQQTGLRVILVSALWNGHIPQIDAVNQAQIDVAAFRHAQRVDLWPLMKPEWWCGWPDVHPCAAAQPDIAEAIRKAIQ